MIAAEAVAAWVAEALDTAPEPTEAQLAKIARLLGLGSAESA